MYTSITEIFSNRIQALRHYIESVEFKGFTSNNADEKDANVVIAMLMHMSKELKLHNLNVEDMEFPEDMSSELIEYSKDAIKRLKDLFAVSQDGKSGRYSRVPKALKEHYRKIEAAAKQNEILYSGALLLLMTYFENLVSQILKVDFQQHPQRMSLENKSVSYKILENSESIEDVKAMLIEEEITSIMYKSLHEWMEYFKKNHKLELECMNRVLPQIKEIIARRNIIVHNDGVVNNIYLNSVPDELRENVKRGDVLRVKKDYITEAVDIIETAGMSLLVEMWIKEFGGDEKEVAKIINLIYDEYLIFEKWDDAKTLYDICLKSKKLNAADELLCKINRWQCYKGKGCFEEVKTEIEKQDISACSPRYRLGVMALLDEYEIFFNLFENQNEIGEEELCTWPLFRNIRECDIYKEKYEMRKEENH